MQGRLSAPQSNQLQFFPNDWKAEFETAHILGFDSIEWIYDDKDFDNPLMSEIGQSEIKEKQRQFDVLVKSICADIFMKVHLTDEDSSSAIEILSNLINCSAQAEIINISIPFVEEHVPATAEQRLAVVRNIKKILSLNKNINFALEIDLSVDDIISIVEAIDSPQVGVCYDTGNAMTFGFDAGDDIRKLGKYLKEIHLKDRIKGTRQSVYLGEGSVNFSDVFSALSEIKFNGLCILQAWRGKNYLDDAKRQLEFAHGLFQKQNN